LAVPELRQYLNVDLDEESSRMIEMHLDQCHRCDELASSIEREMYGLWNADFRNAPLNRFVEEVGFDEAQSKLERFVQMSLTTRIEAQRKHHRNRDLEGQVDDFLILRTLGKGGFANVYLAQQQSLQRLVALKVSSRRTHEAQVMSLLEHPNIVWVYDEKCLPEEGKYLLYMQYMPGGSLDGLLKKLKDVLIADRTALRVLEVIYGESLDITKEHRPHALGDMKASSDWLSVVCWIGAEIFAGLAHAHRQKCLHRDLKPANILFAANGRPCLADFNLSYGNDVPAARPEDDFGGSLPYMSPEQLEVHLGRRSASEVGEASDIYSLGVSLWEMLCGQPLFKSRAPQASRHDIYLDQLQARHQVEARFHRDLNVPRELASQLRRMIAVEPSERPTAREVRRVLRLSTSAATRQFMAMTDKGWTRVVYSHPIAALLALGLVPNALIALVNIQYNHAYTSLDSEKLRDDQVLVNWFVFPLGICLSLTYLFPLNHLGSDGSPTRIRRSMDRCLGIPSFAWMTIFGLWIGTGFAYPLLQLGPQHWMDSPLPFLDFLASQIAHGIIASSLTMLLVAYCGLRFVFPQLLWQGAMPGAQEKLDFLHRRTEFHASLLGVAPPCMLMLLVVLRSLGSTPGAPAESMFTLFFLLGCFCATANLIAATLMPRIRSAFSILQTAIGTAERE
jgi:tRNA A-37 threonylcarbamoyl transferase component Bud32